MSFKTVWIVDAAYMMKASPGRFDYLKLKTELEQKNGVTFSESFYLNSTPNPPTDAQDSFHTCPSCNHHFNRQIQKGVDVGVATLIVKLATQNQYDRLLLIAGDGDFEDAISYV